MTEAFFNFSLHQKDCQSTQKVVLAITFFIISIAIPFFVMHALVETWLFGLIMIITL